jgi:glycosyltransferase involved in cell wall biosynthesis
MTQAIDTKPDAGQPKLRPLRGHVDLVEVGRVKGWAWDPSAPERAVAVELLEGDRVLSRVLASENRPDLLKAGIGTGQYGFTLRLDPHLLPLGLHTVRVRFGDTGVDLAGSPTIIRKPGEDIALDAARLRATIIARLQAIADADELGGFVHMLAGAIDEALAQRFRVGLPVLAQRPAETRDLPPGSFSEAVESIRRRYSEISLDLVRSPLVSVVIVSRDRFAEAHACITAIAAAPPSVPTEVILVDDCSTDETMIARSVLPASVRLFRTAQPLGPVRAMRAGQALAQGRFVLFLDPGVRPSRGAIDAMAAAFEAEDRPGIVGGLLEGGDGKLACAGMAIDPTGILRVLGAGLPPDDPLSARRCEVDAVPALALMIEKALWTRIGGCDEESGDGAHAGADLAMRARKAGRIAIIDPRARFATAISAEAVLTGGHVSGRLRHADASARFAKHWAEQLSAPHPGERPGLRGKAMRALVIDHSWPTPDRDAGSAAVVSHIRAMISLGYDVSFVPGGPPDRDERAMAPLQAMGVACWHAPFVSGPADVLRQLGPELDVVYIHRLPNARGYLPIARELAPRARIVFSVADLHFLRDRREAEVTGDPERLAASEALRVEEMALAAQSDAVITHSGEEARILSAEIAPERVFVVPWTVEARPIERLRDDRSGIAFIGSYAHAPNLDAARFLVDEIMPLVHREDPGIRLILAGAGLPDGFAAGRKGIEMPGWVPDLHDGVLSRVRLTVAPLRFGAGLKGKVLFSLASGVPCLMSECAAEGLPRMTTIQGWTVNGAEAFSKAILELHNGNTTNDSVIEEVRRTIVALTSAETVKESLQKALTKAPEFVEIESNAAPLNA